MGVQAQRTPDCQTGGAAGQQESSAVPREQEGEMLPVTAGEQPAHTRLTLSWGTPTRQRRDQGQAGARDNRLLAFHSIEASEKSETRLVNWDVMRMTNGKSLESKEREKGMQGETNRVVEGTLKMQWVLSLLQVRGQLERSS